MPLKRHKPTSPGRRFATYSDFAEVTRSEPEKSLTEGISKSGGRNSRGRVTSRHRGGGAKRKYRKIDFKRRKDGVPAKVAGIEYDPNRTAHIALLHYADGEKRYILAPTRLKVGDLVESGEGGDIKPELINWGKAGRLRWKGKRPSVRGVAMNPVDHPLGGGEGKSSGGRHPTTPWGKPEGRTRKKNKASNKLIVRRRGKGRG